MNKTIAMKWVKALRSGKYKQGRGRLWSPDGSYCCLGVLAGPVLRNDAVVFGIFLSDQAVSLAKLNDRAGTPRRGKVRIGSDSYANLAVANDCGATFPQIANWIERNWERL